MARYSKIEKEHPKLIEDLKNCPSRVKVAKRGGENELLVFFKKGRMYIHAVRYNGEKDNQFYQPTFEDVFDKIVCDKDEEKLYLSNLFWENYERVKMFREHRHSPPIEVSIEQKALNTINAFIKKPSEELLPHLDFLRALREDMLDYGTLPDHTLRRIANFENTGDSKRLKVIGEISALINELGVDYLQREKERQKNLAREIIIAIENQKH